MQTRSPTSIQTPEKQLAEIQLTHWDDEHDLGLQGERDRTTAQLAVGDTRIIPAEAVLVVGNPDGRTCETGLKGKDIERSIGPSGLKRSIGKRRPQSQH